VDESVSITFKLHDLSQDVEETTDVARDHPEIVKSMHALLKKYVSEGRSTSRR